MDRQVEVSKKSHNIVEYTAIHGGPPSFASRLEVDKLSKQSEKLEVQV